MQRLATGFIVFIAILVLMAGCSFGTKEKAKSQKEEKKSEAAAPAQTPAPPTPANPPGDQAAEAKKQTDLIMSKTTEIEMAKAKDVLEQPGVTYFYDPLNKPDPFKPFSIREDIKAVATENPLLKYDVRYFKLVGILRSGATPKAVFEDPNGKSYVITAGDRIGRAGGVIKSIAKDGVVISETRISPWREGTETVEFTVKLHREQSEQGQ